MREFGENEGDFVEKHVGSFLTSKNKRTTKGLSSSSRHFHSVRHSSVIALDFFLNIKTNLKMTESRSEKDLLLGDIL